MSITRIYVVTDAEITGKQTLVEATSAAQAVRHVARRYTATVARPMEVAKHFREGGEVERAAKESEAADAQERG